MKQTESTGATQSHAADGEIDWIAAERSPEFQDLVRKRRRFVVPATIFFLGWYSAFVLLAGYAPGFMGSSIYQGFTVGYALALTQFLMVWVLGGLYLRRADRDFDPLARRAAARAIEVGPVSSPGDTSGGHEPSSPGRGSGGPGDAGVVAEGGVDDREGGPRGTTGREASSAGGDPEHQAPVLPEHPAPPGAGDGGQAPPALRSSPTPGAGQSRPPGGEGR